MSEQVRHYFKDIPVLKSDRLILRGVKQSDAPEIIDLAVYDGFFAQNEADVITILKKVDANRAKGESLQWLICLKESFEIAGLCSYHRGYPNNTGEIGYVLKEAYRGKGLMTEAVKLITDFGINNMQLSRVLAYTDPSNTASMNVLKRAGFQQLESKPESITFAFP